MNAAIVGLGENIPAPNTRCNHCKLQCLSVSVNLVHCHKAASAKKKKKTVEDELEQCACLALGWSLGETSELLESSVFWSLRPWVSLRKRKTWRHY